MYRSGFLNIPLLSPPPIVGTSVPLSPLPSSLGPSGDKRNGMRRGFPFLSDLLLDSALLPPPQTPGPPDRMDADLLTRDLMS